QLALRASTAAPVTSGRESLAHEGQARPPREYASMGASWRIRPAVVLDPFGGTGTTAMVAKALGRHGISDDMSADYCRLDEWRTNDRDQLAKVLGIAKAEPPRQAESLFDLLGEETA